MLELRHFETGDAGAVRTLDDAAISAAGTRGRGGGDLASIPGAYIEDGWADTHIGSCRLSPTGAEESLSERVA